MSAAQRDYLLSHGIDPWSLAWGDGLSVGLPGWCATEVACLPDGQLLPVDGRPVSRGVE